MNVFAQMYKQIDKDGNVTYTDVPDQSDAKRIKPPPISTISAPNLPPVDPNSSDSSETDQAETQRSSVEYRSISIVSPENGGAVRANGGSFSVEIKLDPPLDTESKHKIVLLMDGSIKAESQSTTVALQGIERGEHSFSAQVLS
ncbi:MAG: DUF4124 domain-containing protein, partial [Thiohalomonadales bacterium]